MTSKTNNQTHVIGQGSFGIVTKLNHKLALKTFNNNYDHDTEMANNNMIIRILKKHGTKGVSLLENFTLLLAHKKRSDLSSVMRLCIDGSNLGSFYLQCENENNIGKKTELLKLLTKITKDLVNKMLLFLQFMHDAKVFHNDITLSNIMVCSGGEPKLIDFGSVSNNCQEYHDLGTEEVMHWSRKRRDFENREGFYIVRNCVRQYAPDYSADYGNTYGRDNHCEAYGKSDMFGFGVVLSYLWIARRYLNQTKTDIFWTSNIPFLVSCLVSDAEEYRTIDQVIHEFRLHLKK